MLVLGLKRDLRSEQDPNGIIYPQEVSLFRLLLLINKPYELRACQIGSLSLS